MVLRLSAVFCCISVLCSHCTLLAVTNHLASQIQIRRLRIEIEKLQWLHQQELSEMKHNLGMEGAVQSSASFWPMHQILVPVVCVAFGMW